MDLVKRRELAFLLAFKGVTRDMVKKGDGAVASVSEWQGPHVAFLKKNQAPPLERVYIYIYMINAHVYVYVCTSVYIYRYI